VSFTSVEVEQSFRNIVMFYSKELKLVDNGSKATLVFNDAQRKKLTKIGIFERVYLHRGCRLTLTEKTRQLLNSVDLYGVSPLSLI
jgi:hypothetical protein